MSGRIRVAALLLTGLVVQATLFTEIRVQGASVELMMLMAILAGFHGGPQRGAIVAFCAGLLQDSIAATPLGLHALVFPPLAGDRRPCPCRCNRLWSDRRRHGGTGVRPGDLRP